MTHFSEKYISQVVSDPRYSIFYVKELVSVAGADFKLEHDFTQQGANLVILHSIQICTSANGLSELILVDQFNRKLMDFFETIAMCGFFPLNFVINSGKLQLTLQGSAGLKIRLVAIYQFVQNEEH